MNSGGSYNVAEAEQSQNTLYADALVCNVWLLDSTCVAFKVDKHCRGQTLLDLTFDYLELLERDFFGLVFNARQSRGESILKWLHPTKEIKRQCTDSSPYTLWFRVKFYVPDPICLHEEYTRYQFFLQVRKDILEGRLPVSKSMAAHLAGLVLQAELGDYNPDDCHPGYASQFRLLQHQNPDFDNQASDWHRKCGSMLPSAAELEFLNVARQLERYGVKTNEVLDIGDGHKSSLLGVSHSGLTVFRNNAPTVQLPWSNILNIRFSGKKFTVQLRSATVPLHHSNGTALSGTRTPSNSTLVASSVAVDKSNLKRVFQFSSAAQTKSFWQYAVACHAFFRVHEPAQVGFSRMPAFGAGGTTAISATAIYSAISRATSGFRRYFSLARRGSISTNSLGGVAGGVERTLSTVMELRRNSRVFDRGFSRSNSRRSARRSGNFSSYGPTTRATSSLSLSADRPTESHTPSIPVRSYGQAPPGVRASLVSSNSTKTGEVSSTRNLPPLRSTTDSQSASRSVVSSIAISNRNKKTPSPAGPEASHSRTNQTEVSTLRNSYLNITSSVQPERSLRVKPPKPGSPVLGATRSSQRRSHPSSPSINQRMTSGSPKSPTRNNDPKTKRSHPATSPDVEELSSSEDSDQDVADFDPNEASRYWNARRVHTVTRASRPQTRVQGVPVSLMHESYHGRTSQEEDRSRPSSVWSTKRQAINTDAHHTDSPETPVINARASSSSRMSSRLNTSQQAGSQKKLSDIGTGRHKGTTDDERPNNRASSSYVRDPLHPGAPAGDRRSTPIEFDAADGLVTIRIRPDSRGRFGFNIRGGVDFGIPIIVSRVGPNTPADLCIPRLSEGDQLIAINGRYVAGYTHTEVVSFLNTAREDPGNILELLVKPTDYVTDYLNGEANVPDSGDAPPIPPRPSSMSSRQPLANDRLFSSIRKNTAFTTKRSSTTSHSQGSEPLLQSIAELEASLSDGSILTRFDQLPRRKPGFTTIASRLNENVLKNRYRDISPYDQTRVILKQGAGDYINASFVIMDFPKAGFTLNYIAAQGPLPSTYGDFWQMCWEQYVGVVVMLTAVSERGRVKCHQYWPDLGQTIKFSAASHSPLSSKQAGNQMATDIQIQTVQEEITGDFAFREFSICQSPPASQRSTSTQTNTTVKPLETRRITQLQYITWPDHGVPNNPTDFIDFVEKVREKRGTDPAPIVVHCSAGIGRTGVLITMETAMNLIERGHPIKPLELVQLMRSQRALLIQTTSQFQFVCETILKVFQRDHGEGVHK